MSMNKEEYISGVEVGLNSILNEYLFNNYKNQLAARKLSLEFTATFKENYLWNKTLYLTTNACILLNENRNKRLALETLKVSAEVYENLSSISKDYDKDFCLILSCLCYDIAGYQANALCLIRTIENYSFVSEGEMIELNEENYILDQVREILLKTIFRGRTNLREFPGDMGLNFFNKFLSSWYESILNGSNSSYEKDIKVAYRYYLDTANIPISHLLFLLSARVDAYTEKSIWQNLNKVEGIQDNAVWQKFIKLLANDIYDKNEIKPVNKRISKFEFWTSQIRALEKGVLGSSENFVIQMPTSAGKTFIAELAILRALIKHPNKKCIYVAPFRALTNEKESELADYISKLGYSVSALSGSYEIDEFQEIILADTDVLIATPEKIDLLFRLNPSYFNEVSLLVVDEGHIVGDISSRASLLEFLIIRLRIKVPDLQTLFISAVMPPANADEYSVWLSGKKDRVIRSLLYDNSPQTEEWEPTRKLIGSFLWEGQNGRLYYKDIQPEDENSKVKQTVFIPAIIKEHQFANKYPTRNNKIESTAALALELSKLSSTLIFCGNPRDINSVAKRVLTILEDTALEVDLKTLYPINTNTASYFYASKWFGSDSYILKCIARGIGIHFGDLPESVRTAVESDFRSGKFKLLLATNTISQGINFPIKNIVIYSVVYNRIDGRVSRMSNRDFWNLVGRAGRAGRETEGQVLFVINSWTDNKYYEEYTNKANLEPAYSMFFNVLNALVENRISNKEYEGYIRTLSESYLLSLLADEAVETDVEVIVEKILNNSLFKVQIQTRNLNIEPIRKDDVPSDLLKIFGDTGLSLQTNNSMNEFINANMEQLEFLVVIGDYKEVLKLILDLFDKSDIEEIQSFKLDKLEIKPSEYLPVIQKWMDGVEISELQTEWLKVNKDSMNLNVLIAEALYYKYTWAISSFITLLIHKLDIEVNNIPEGIKSLPSYIKYGLNNSTACLARSMGIKSREVASLLANKSNNKTGRDFIKWLANLERDEVTSYNLSPFENSNILEVANKLTPNRYIDVPTVFNFSVKGIPFEEERINTSLAVKVDNILRYRRDTANEFDPFAIKLFLNNQELGFIPRDLSRIIAIEIDINEVVYKVIVAGVAESNGYNEITITMTKE
jgi:helicase